MLYLLTSTHEIGSTSEMLPRRKIDIINPSSYPMKPCQPELFLFKMINDMGYLYDKNALLLSHFSLENNKYKDHTSFAGGELTMDDDDFKYIIYGSGRPIIRIISGTVNKFHGDIDLKLPENNCIKCLSVPKGYPNGPHAITGGYTKIYDDNGLLQSIHFRNTI